LTVSLFICETEKLLIEIKNESLFPEIFANVLICVNLSLIIKFSLKQEAKLYILIWPHTNTALLRHTSV